MSDSSDSESTQTDNSDTVNTDNSETILSDNSESIQTEPTQNNTTLKEEIIQTDPNTPIDEQELIDIRLKIKKHIDNVNRLKQLNDSQKDIQTQKKTILAENKSLQNDIVEFAEDYGISKMTMKNGYILTFTTIEKPKPINEEILRTGIAEQLKHYRNNETIGNIGIDNFINELIGSIDSKRKEGMQAIRSVKFNKPKGNSRKKSTKKPSRKSSNKKSIKKSNKK